MILFIGWIALGAAIVVTVATTAGPPAAHAIAPVLVAELWAVAFWAARRARARDYHRHRYTRAKCHAAPTRMHRARLAARRLRTVRIRMAAIEAPEPTRALTPGQQIRQIEAALGPAVRVVAGPGDGTYPTDRPFVGRAAA